MANDKQNDLTIEPGPNDGTSESAFLELSKDEVLRKLTTLARTLNAEIDSGSRQDITVDRITSELKSGTIFKFLAEFPSVEHMALKELNAEVREWLLAEWQSMQNATIPEEHGVTRNGFCLLLAYVIEGIQMRTFGEETWPGPEP